jgi:hypothetical protein
MKLPNGHTAIVEIAKLGDYCLSLEHPRGQHNARVFQSLLGITAIHIDELRKSLIEAAIEGNALPGASNQYGIRYIIDFELKRGSRAANIRSCWIIRTGETAPRFVTC